MHRTLWDNFTGPAGGRSVEHNGFQVYLNYPIQVVKGEQLLFTIESSRGAWEQGVSLTVKGTVGCEGLTVKKGFGLWASTLPRKGAVVTVNATDGLLWLTNVWLTGTANTGPMSGIHNCGMVVEELPHGWRFRCSDGNGLKPLSSLRTPRDFNNLVFRVERVSHPDGHGEPEAKK